MTKKALGKGLSALFTTKEDELNDKVDTKSHDNIVELSLDLIIPNPYQPREIIKDEKIDELAASILECGLMHPISVRRIANKYEIIEGERRFRSCKKLGFTKIPVIIRNVDDSKMLLMALVENLQRENLNAIEEAKGYNKLINEFKLTQKEVGEKVGKSRSNVANMLRLLNLPHMVREALELQKIDIGHARALLGLENPNLQRKACKIIIDKSFTVRETERLVKEWAEKGIKDVIDPKTTKAVNPEIRNLQETLSEKLKTRIRIIDKNNKGKIIINYYSVDDFQRVYDLLNV